MAALAGPTAATADSCANAPFRGGPGANLPDCRAYEQISPVDKSGNDVLNTSPGLSFGDRVLFTSAGSINGSESLTFDTTYMATRGSDWSTKGTDAPLDASGFLQRGTFAVSDDGTKAVVVSQRAYTAGAVEGGSNIYIRDLTQPQSYRLAVSTPSRVLSDNLTQLLATNAFAASNGDLSAFAVATQAPLLPGAPDDGNYYLYLWHDGTLSLASQLSNGDPVAIGPGGLGGSPVNNTPSKEYHYLSDDGTRLLFRPQDGTGALYQYVEGQGSTLISRSQRQGDNPATPVASSNAAGSPDGRTVTFDSSTELTDTGTGAVYRWSADAPASAPITDRYEVPSFTNVSPDGRYLWFNRTVDTGTPGNPNYVGSVNVFDTQTGVAHRAALLSGFEPGAPVDVRYSPDGHRLAFLSQSPVGGVDNRNPACKGPGNVNNEYCQNIFTYDADTPSQTARCVSCAAQADIVGGAQFERGGTFIGGRLSRTILDDGRVFFDTVDRLTSRDTNAVSDVYEVDPDGTTTLLSPGNGSEPSVFRDASPDGKDVLFVSGEQLVPQDRDALLDMYTARTGGGIASQQVAPAAGGDACAGEACRPETTGTPPRPAPGSAAFTSLDVVNPRFSFSRPSARTLRSAGRSGRLTVPVKVNLSGRVTATLTGKLSGRKTSRAGSAAVRTSKAGTVRLTLRLSRQARAVLRRKGTLKLRLTVRYSRRDRAASTVLTFTTGRAAASNRGGAR